MDLEDFLRLGIDVLRLVPLTLVFYIPALLGAAIMRERGKDYRLRAGLTFALGFGVILAVHLLISTASVGQIMTTTGVSLLQMAVATLLAFVTVYKLAD